MRQEQRQSARKILEAGAVITIDGIPLDVQTMDISPGGLCISSSKQLAVGKNCHIRFEVPQEEAGMTVAAASAHVVYCFFGGGRYRVGLQFLSLPGNSADIIQRFFER